MEKVTYILGAGFSAPLGLPVMQDFLAKSKDLYFSDPRRYRHFQRVFELVRNLSITKNYFDADLFNIEEILSILEMQVFVDKWGPNRAQHGRQMWRVASSGSIVRLCGLDDPIDDPIIPLSERVCCPHSCVIALPAGRLNQP